MDHLYEYVKECMEYTKTLECCKDKSDEEIFDDVMENVISSVEYYSIDNYNKAKEKEEK